MVGQNFDFGTNFFAQNYQMAAFGQHTYMLGTRTKIVQYQQGYFGPATQFSPYTGCFSFLTQGFLNFESAKKINERRSQRSAFFESAAHARAPTNFSEGRSRSTFESGALQ